VAGLAALLAQTEQRADVRQRLLEENDERVGIYDWFLCKWRNLDGQLDAVMSRKVCDLFLTLMACKIREINVHSKHPASTMEWWLEDAGFDIRPVEAAHYLKLQQHHCERLDMTALRPEADQSGAFDARRPAAEEAGAFDDGSMPEWGDRIFNTIRAFVPEQPTPFRMVPLLPTYLAYMRLIVAEPLDKPERLMASKYRLRRMMRMLGLDADDAQAAWTLWLSRHGEALFYNVALELHGTPAEECMRLWRPGAPALQVNPRCVSYVPRMLRRMQCFSSIIFGPFRVF
jgi:hypothetical protein